MRLRLRSTGRQRLEPLSLAHVSDLTVAGADPDIWRYMPYPTVRSEGDMRAQIEDLLARQARTTDLPFAVWHLAEGRAIGMTRQSPLCMCRPVPSRAAARA